MTEVRFYHLQHSTLESVLPQLLEKGLERGHCIIVKCPDEKMVGQLNEHLWTYRAESFLPHGSAKDGRGESQPVWLTSGDDNPNGAGMLVLCGGVPAPGNLADYCLCCEIFDGSDPEKLDAARSHWVACRDQGFKLSYWQQVDGRWVQKA